MATLTITVCDVCGEEAHETWNIHGPERSYLAELCTEHSQQVKAALEAVVPDMKKPHPSRVGVLTPDFEARIRKDL